MKIKSYYSATVEAAMVQARQELGSDAMLLNSKRAAPEARHLGEYEVVFASPAGGPVAAAPTPESGDRLSHEIADLRRQMERMAATFQRVSTQSATNFVSHPEMAELFSALIAADVDAHTAHRLISETRNSMESGMAGSIDGIMRRELESLCPVNANLGVPESGRKIVALVGPPGCGKTTTLAKLAVQYGLVPRLRTQLLSIDMERIGAADQLRSLAFILGVGFTAVETSGALVQALEEHQQKELILIDTPGFGAREIAGAGPLAELLASREDIDVHLVLPASMKNADLSRTVDRFEIFRPAKLIFTRLDETEAPGCILNELQRSGKSLSFLNFGQRIPEDLRPADPALLASLLLGERTRKAAGIAA